MRAADERSGTEDGSGRSGARPRLVVAEGNAERRAELRQMLAERYELEVCERGTEALSVARAVRPDLLLLSAHLPDLEPVHALEKLSEACADEVPVIIHASERSDESVARCLNLGAVDYVVGASAGQELLARIERALRHSQQRRALLALARTDALTGLSNFGALHSRLEEEFKRASRYHYPLAVLMIDLDRLKELNDRFGHEVGNRAILALARQLRQNLRQTDFAARYGGDEFVVLLPHSSLREATAFAERLQASVLSVPLVLPEGALGQLTFSAGIGVHSAERSMESSEALLEAADAALYEAKRSGRDRVATFEPPETPSLHDRSSSERRV